MYFSFASSTIQSSFKPRGGFPLFASSQGHGVSGGPVERNLLPSTAFRVRFYATNLYNNAKEENTQDKNTMHCITIKCNMRTKQCNAMWCSLIDSIQYNIIHHTISQNTVQYVAIEHNIEHNRKPNTIRRNTAPNCAVNCHAMHLQSIEPNWISIKNGHKEETETRIHHHTTSRFDWMTVIDWQDEITTAKQTACYMPQLPIICPPPNCLRSLIDHPTTDLQRR